MEELGVVLVIIFGILSLILFFKVWAMCNNVKKILRKMDEKPVYRYSVNTSPDLLNSEMANVRELIFCGKTEEAKCELKRLLYQFVLERKEWDEQPNRYGALYIERSNQKAEMIIELLASIGETIENKEDILIPTDK